MSKAREELSFGTVRAFLALGKSGCSGLLCEVLDGAFAHPQPKEERSAFPLAGGILQYGYQCGMTWGSALAAGAEACRRFGAGPRAEAAAILAAGRLVATFRAQNAHVNCLEITNTDRSKSALQLFTYFVLKGGSVACARRAARFAPAALADIEAALSAAPAEAPPAPLSCAATLVRKLGCSDEQAVMASGFAGGIGLCGGACGALGAAIWIFALRSLEDGAKKVDYKSPAALALVERFLACTGYEFECEKIAGRRFDGVADHARYLREGGCAKVLEVLAAPAPANITPSTPPPA